MEMYLIKLVSNLIKGGKKRFPHHKVRIIHYALYINIYIYVMSYSVHLKDEIIQFKTRSINDYFNNYK